MKRVPYETMVKEFKRVLVKKGFSEKRSEAAAEIFAQNSLAGVYSHGLNRFPRVVSYLEKGEIDPDIAATCELQLGAMERWNGHRGFGPLNAKLAMDRACGLAKEYGIGPGMHRNLLVQHHAEYAGLGRHGSEDRQQPPDLRRSEKRRPPCSH